MLSFLGIALSLSVFHGAAAAHARVSAAAAKGHITAVEEVFISESFPCTQIHIIFILSYYWEAPGLMLASRAGRKECSRHVALDILKW